MIRFLLVVIILFLTQSTKSLSLLHTSSITYPKANMFTSPPPYSKISSSSSLSSISKQSKFSEPAPSNPTTRHRRGAFIVLEGVDRCGKTTQCGLLVKKLISMSLEASLFRFPDRTTTIGQLINDYLQNTKGKAVDDRAIHLLFSANRWEAADGLIQTLQNGTTVICDRYAYSGVAFSSAKNRGNKDDLSIDWCKAPDAGLPAPDAVIFLDLDQAEAEKRGGYGAERYETREMQKSVREKFNELQISDEKEGRTPWHVVDASMSLEQVEKHIFSIVKNVLNKVNDDECALKKIWSDGEIEM